MQIKPLIAKAVAVFAMASGTSADTIVSHVHHTFFGDPDTNDGYANEYDCGRGYTAKGSGSFKDPLTMASVHGEYNKCEIVWDTYTQKYLRNEDICATCNGNQIAIWTGGGGSKKVQLRCERRLTHKLGHIVIRFGSKGYDANTGPLWDGSCHPENVYPDAS